MTLFALPLLDLLEELDLLRIAKRAQFLGLRHVIDAPFLGQPIWVAGHSSPLSESQSRSIDPPTFAYVSSTNP